MPGPVVADAHDQELRRRAAFHVELDAALSRVLEDVARDLGDRGGDARLVLGVEAQVPRDLPRALAGHHHVVLGAQRHGQERRGSSARAPRPAQPTSTVTSSRPRE